MVKEVKGVSQNRGGPPAMSELSESRLWKTLDNIAERLNGIESQISEIVRLEERVNNHEQALGRFGKRLDSHDLRLRDAELWQANHGDKASVERMIANVQDEITLASERVKALESAKDIRTGQKDVTKEIFKWLSGILAAVVILLIKGD